jgi:hypothetical protein
MEIHGPPNIAAARDVLVAAVTAASPASIVAPNAARDPRERVMRMIDSLKVVSIRCHLRELRLSLRAARATY